MRLSRIGGYRVSATKTNTVGWLPLSPVSGGAAIRNQKREVIMAQFKFLGAAQQNWTATSGNVYLAVEGVIAIPDDMGSDVAEAVACGLFERLGGSPADAGTGDL